MDLLLEIKQYLQKLKDLGIYDGEIELGVLENFAEECYKHKYKKLTKYINAPLAPDIQKELKEHISRIKEIIKNENHN